MERSPAPAEPELLGLCTALEASGRFRRDTALGGILHLGKTSFREMCRTESVHITIRGNRLSAHVDGISPLNCEPGAASRYSVGAVVAHNLETLRVTLARRLGRVPGRHRCQLECEVVAVAGGEVVAVAGGEVVAVAGGEVVDVAPAAVAGATQVPAGSVPFGPIDEAVHLLDSEDAPWSVQLEARVAGTLDESRLRAALARALRAHPMGRARKAPAGRTARRERWEITEVPEVDPLRVVDCPDDEALAAARSELQSLPVPLAESPPLRVRLARHPDGDVVMLNVNHAAMDGFGALRLLRSVARAYAGEPDPLPTLDLAEARELPARLVAAGARTRARRLLALADKLRDLVVPPARLAPEGAGEEPGYGLHHRSLSAGDTEAVVAPRHPGTVNDVLLAALHLAVAGWNEEHGAPCGRIGVLVPANLRPREWREEVVGNFSLPARVSTRRRDRRGPADALAAVTAQTRRKKEVGMGTALLEVLRGAPLLPLWAKRALVALLPLTGNRLVDTAMLSNLGVVEPPCFGPAGCAQEVWFSPPVRMPLGMAVGAATVAGRLHLAFRYHRRLFDAGAARRFAELFLAELERVVGARPGPGR